MFSDKPEDDGLNLYGAVAEAQSPGHNWRSGPERLSMMLWYYWVRMEGREENIGLAVDE
jgi:hypothetical protein